MSRLASAVKRMGGRRRSACLSELLHNRRARINSPVDVVHFVDLEEEMWKGRRRRARERWETVRHVPLNSATANFDNTIALLR